VIDVLAKLTKKDKKNKERELQSQENSAKEGKTLS